VGELSASGCLTWVDPGACLRGSRAAEELGKRLDGGRDLVGLRQPGSIFVVVRLSLEISSCLPACEPYMDHDYE